MDFHNPTPELITALIEVQKEVKHALKDGSNPFFKSDYATYEAVVNAVKQPLNKHGVMFQHHAKLMEGGACIDTVFYGHGGSISSGPIFVPAEKRDPQAYGSALTYAKRYSLAMATGVGHQKDDDAEAAMRRDASGKSTPVSKTKSKAPKQEPYAYELSQGGELLAGAYTASEFMILCEDWLHPISDQAKAIFIDSSLSITRALVQSDAKLAERFFRLIGIYDPDGKVFKSDGQLVNQGVNNEKS